MSGAFQAGNGVMRAKVYTINPGYHFYPESNLSSFTHYNT